MQRQSEDVCALSLHGHVWKHSFTPEDPNLHTPQMKPPDQPLILNLNIKTVYLALTLSWQGVGIRFISNMRFLPFMIITTWLVGLLDTPAALENLCFRLRKTNRARQNACFKSTLHFGLEKSAQPMQCTGPAQRQRRKFAECSSASARQEQRTMLQRKLIQVVRNGDISGFADIQN